MQGQANEGVGGETPVRWPRGLLTLASVAMAAGYGWLRALSWPQIFSDAPPILLGSDAYQHAHRVQVMLERWPAPLFHDSFVFHPEGTTVEWPIAMDWVLRMAGRMAARARCLPAGAYRATARSCIALFCRPRHPSGRIAAWTSAFQPCINARRCRTEDG